MFKMKKLKRYKLFTTDSNIGTIIEDNNGEFVRFEDIKEFLIPIEFLSKPCKCRTSVTVLPRVNVIQCDNWQGQWIDS